MNSTRVRESGCPTEAAWLAYMDGERDAEARRNLGRHLEHCSECQRTVAEIAVLSNRVDQALLEETPPTDSGPTPSRRRTYGGLAAAAAVLGAVLVVSSPARHVLADALSVFQPQKVEAVPVPAGSLQKIAQQLTENGTVSLDTFGSAHLLTHAVPYTTSSTNIKSRSGLPELWPSALGPATATVRPAETASFSLNVARINPWLQSEGATTLFPASLQGESFTVNVPTMATIRAAVPGGVDSLIEMGTPALEVPSGVPIAQVRTAILNLPFLPANFRTALSAVGNWRNTAVLPLPGNPVNTTFLGHPAVIEPAPGGKAVSVLWIQAGTVAVFTEERSAGITPAQFQSDISHLFS